MIDGIQVFVVLDGRQSAVLSQLSQETLDAAIDGRLKRALEREIEQLIDEVVAGELV